MKMEPTIEDEKAAAARTNANKTKLVVVDGNNIDGDDYVLVDKNARHGDDYVLIDKNARRAHICCGCDTRNAIFIVNIISVCFYLLAIISFSLITGDGLNYDDDHVQSVMDALDRTRMSLTISIFVVGLICNITAIFGAAYFNKIAITIGAMWFLFETIRSLCFYDIGSAIITASFCYPHAVFFFELKNGVMSKENYPKEKVCCDCCCSC